MKLGAGSFLVLLLALLLAGCTGAGPSSGTAGGRPRCASGAPADTRPMFFIFCAESP
jgi:hypothetical protein